MSLYGEWKSAIIVVATDDDLSDVVNLGDSYEFMNLLIPAITSAQLSVMVSDTAGGTYYDLGDSQKTAAGTGSYATTIKLGGYQFIKIKSSAAQAANRTFSVRGFRM